MIESIIGLSGTALLGGIVGEISNIRSAREKKEERTHELECLRTAKENGQLQAFLTSFYGQNKDSRSEFGDILRMFGYTICIVIILGCLFPTAPLITFNPGNDPTTIDLFFVKFSWGGDRLYTITLGGVAYALCYPLVGILGATLTGISPGRRFK